MKRKRHSTTSMANKGQTEAENSDQGSEPQSSGRSLADLPHRILIKFLLKLPIKGIFVCKCVCKTWNDLISDPEFAKSQFRQAEIYPMIRTLNPTHVSRILYFVQPEKDRVMCNERNRRYLPNHQVEMKLGTKFKLPLRNIEPVLGDRDTASVVFNSHSKTKKKECIKLKPKDHKYNIVNSCNGLLCLSEPNRNNPVVVCNPVTGEFVNLPETEVPEGPPGYRNSLIYSGLGFSLVSNLYKFIRIFHKYTLDLTTGKRYYDGEKAEVHTLGTGLWKKIGSAPSVYKLAFPTYLNGSSLV